MAYCVIACRMMTVQILDTYWILDIGIAFSPMVVRRGRWLSRASRRDWSRCGR